MKFNVILFILVTLLFSCEQVPYPEGGELVLDPTPVEVIPDDVPVAKPHSIDVDPVIKFKEGNNRVYKIYASVDEPGEPIVVAEDLPEGAVFDEKTFELQWKPGFFTANDVNLPSVDSVDYPVVFEVSSTIESDESKRRYEVILRVSDNPRGIRVTRDRNTSVKEGSTLESIITIVDSDFPTGPFFVDIDNVPENVEIRKITENKYSIFYQPNHFVVSLSKDKTSKKEFDGVLTVKNPRGGITTIDTEITVLDKRIYPIIKPPEQITQSLDVTLQVVSYDPNKEIAPDMELTSDNPKFGKFETTVTKLPDNSSSVLNVRWTDIPPIHKDTVHTLNFKTCVLSKVNVVRLCEQGSTQVKIILKERAPPVIVRSDWPVGELIYLGFKEKHTRRLIVVDKEDRRLTPKVEIMPADMNKYVKWEKGKISLRFDKSGTFQFSVVATSDYNVSSAQSFIVEVFPETRKKILFFADSTRDPESLFYKAQFNAQMMNPAIQVISKRNISDRDTLIITTSTLFDTDNKSAIMRAISAIPNIVVASPLIENLPSEFLQTLRTDYDLAVIGRYSQFSNGKPLEDMYFVKSKEFKDSTNKVFLKGKASRESRDPILFNGGLYEREKICKGVLGLTHDGNNPLVLGVVCDRQDGVRGRITLLGTEWADIKTSQSDQWVPSSWFNTMLKGKF